MAHPREELIRQTAFALYRRCGCVEGHALEHWLRAEAEINRLAREGPAAPVHPPLGSSPASVHRGFSSAAIPAPPPIRVAAA